MATGTDIFVNFDRQHDKACLYAVLRDLKGPHRVNLRGQRGGRTHPQNAYYWGVVVKSLQLYLREQGECLTSDQVHELMKAKFLRLSVHNPATGEVIGETTRSTAKLSVEEFSEYLELCISWLADMFGIVCPDADGSSVGERAPMRVS